MQLVDELKFPWSSFHLDYPTTLDQMGRESAEYLDSVCEKIAYVEHAQQSLDSNTIKTLEKEYTARGIAASAAIEGYLLTAEEAAEMEQVDSGYDKGSSQHVIANLHAAYRLPIKIPATWDDISKIHAKLYDELNRQDYTPGEIRACNVRVGGYIAPRYEDCRELLDKFEAWNATFAELPDSSAYTTEDYPKVVLLAILSHLYAVKIHPFPDGNGRLARALETHVLKAGGIPTISSGLLSEHYWQLRWKYYEKLDKASKAYVFSYKPFIRFALTGLSNQLDQQIERLNKQ